MCDPELVARAQRTAARLEQARERWRALQGLGERRPSRSGYGGAQFPELAQRHVLSQFPSQSAKRFLAVASATKSSILAVMSQLPGSQRWHRVLPGSGARLRNTRAG
jgi:hypothetical protein